MGNIGRPMGIPEIGITPEPSGGIPISDNMQQSLACLTAYWRNLRMLLKASPNGVLFTSSPQLENIIHVTGVGANYDYKGSDIACSEVLVMAHPDNTGRIWVRPNAVATDATGWPLGKSDVMGFGLTNLNMLNIRIVTAGEIVIIAYTM